MMVATPSRQLKKPQPQTNFHIAPNTDWGAGTSVPIPASLDRQDEKSTDGVTIHNEYIPG